MDIEQLLSNVGDEKEPPPPPEGGIPAQRLPSWIRNIFRCGLLPFIIFDLSIQKLARKIIRPPFKQAGHCLQRGNCCHYIMIQKANGWWGKLYLLWHTEVNGFFLRSKEAQEYAGKEVHVMGCRHLQKDGRCGQYQLRPMVCRNWPIIEHFGTPRVIKGCGFRPIARTPDGEKLLQLGDD